MSPVPAGRLSIEIVAEIARLQKDLDAAKRAVKAASNDIGASARAANDNLGLMNTGMARVNTTSKAMRANFINLARQGQDVATMFALGAPPMQIFASQGAQIVDVLAMMKAEANQTGTSLSRMALGGLAKIGPYVAIVAALGGAFALLSDEVNENAEVQVSWKNTALGAYDAVAAALNDQVSAAFDALGINVGEVWTYIVDTTKTAANLIIGAASLAPRMIITAFKVLPAGIADVFFTAVNGGIRAINGLVERAVAAVNGYASLVNPILEKVGLSIPKLVAPRISEVENAYSGAAFAAAKAFSGTLTDTVSNNFIGDIADAIRPFAVARQLSEAAGEAGKTAGKSAGRAMGKAAAEEFPKAFLDAVNDNARLASDNAEAMAKAFGDSLKNIKEEDEARKRLQASYSQTIKDMQRELQLLNLTGEAREQRIRDFEKEDFFEANKGLDDLNGKWAEYIRLRDELRARQGVVDAETASIQQLSGALQGLAGLIPGRAGQALSDILNLDIGLKDGTTEKLSDTLANAFGKGSDVVSKAIFAAFQGAQIGGAVDGLFKAIGIKSSNTGAQLGGAIGGAFLGPLGAIGGSILGGLVGGMLKSTPRASATVSVIGGEAMQSAIRGNNGKLKGIAEGLAGGLIDGLSQIADAFDAELASFGAISIGKRKDTFRVDLSGQGRTKNMPSFATEAEAIAFALQSAIERGAIAGLRAGADALLRAGGDLETQLQKALAFEGVFDRLAEATDPLAFALSNLDKEFAALRKIFDEARASTEDYAALEQLYQIERNKLLEQFNDTVEEGNNLLRERQSLEARILELQGDAAGALAIQRQLELDALDASLRPLLAQVFALEDQAEAARVAAEASEALAQAEAAIAQERLGLEGRLLQLQGDTAALRERELAALDPSNRAILASIFALEDQAAANQAATEAANAAAEAARELAAEQQRIADERFGLEGRILQLLGDTAALRARELAALDPSNRALLERIFAIEDEQAAVELATRAAEELAEAQARAAAEALAAQERAAQEALALQERIANEREGLETRLLQLLGDTTALRQRELASLDPSNRALLEHIFALEDERTAAEAATRAADELADAQRAMANAQRDIANEISSLQRELLQAQGNTAALRELDLAGLRSDEARAIQQQIYAIEDARAAQEALAEAQREAARAAEEAAQAAIRAAEEAQRAYEQLLGSAQDALRQAVAAERSTIEARLDPLRSELERLVSAITPEATDITAALETRDFLTDGLSLAQKLADASRGVIGDTERVITAQRELARRELFRMVETRQINEDILDRLIGDASNFGDNFATRVDLQREQGRTAGLLAELAKVAEENAKAAQAAEDERAAEARDQVLAQIEALQSQIAIGEAQLATLDATLERFGLLNNSVLSVADAVRELEAVTAQGFSGGLLGALGGTGGVTGAGAPGRGNTMFGTPPAATTQVEDVGIENLRIINELIRADQELRAAEGRFGGFMGARAADDFEAVIARLGGPLDPFARLQLDSLATNAAAILAQAGGDISQVGAIISGPLPQDTSQFSSAPSEEIAALKAEQEKTNEYLRELVKVNLKQERDLKELVIQGEAV